MARFRREPFAPKWRRRAVSLPLVFLVGTLVLAAFPLLAVLALLYAVVEHHRLAVFRCVCFFTTYLFGELLFLTIAFAQWLASLPGTPGAAGRQARWARWLEAAWGGWLYRSGEIFFRLRIHVDGLEALQSPRPLIVLMRHASMGDTVLAPVWLAGHGRRHLRYVAKSELRLDPLFDVIGSRLGTCFVDRQSSDSAGEVAAVYSLLEELEPSDAIVLYPEGTRFSEEKRVRSIARLEGKLAPELYAVARTLRHMLPPRLGGPIALLERNQQADVVFCVHVGYECAARFKDLVSGSAIGQEISVTFRKVPLEDLEAHREALSRWLLDEWALLDKWVAQRSPAAPTPALAEPAPSR